MKKGLIALAIAAVSGMRRPAISEFQITSIPAIKCANIRVCAQVSQAWPQPNGRRVSVKQKK